MTAIATPLQATPLRAVDDLRIGPDGELTAVKAISATDPYLPGHYPGAPIYPGVFVIETVLQAARRFLGIRGLALDEVVSVRLQAPLLPGDTLRASLVLATDGAGYLVRARCARSDGAAAATVSLRCTELADRTVGVPEDITSGPAPLVNVRDLLPHRPPILLVDRVVAASPGHRVVTEYTVRAGEPCFRHAPDRCAYPDSLVLESFIQSCAVLFLLGRKASGTLAFGSARGLRLREPVFPGQTIRHEAWLDRLVGDTALLHGRSIVDGRACLSVTNLAVLARDGLAELAA